jgi:RNA polymerase sigma-70 factor (ECF subfamily)
VLRSEPRATEPLGSARGGDATAFVAQTEPHRRELTVYCYRMLGSLQEAEDLVQETFLRAWQKIDTYGGRGSFRAWLYKIATNACLDALERRPKRTLPPLRIPAADPHASPPQPVLEPVWLEPFPDELLPDVESNPAARYESRESITLAFLAAIQTLPPRQRAVLVLCDVLDWRSAEAAALLDLSVSAVNSALYRARSSLSKRYHRANTERNAGELDVDTRALLTRYVRAWEAARVDDLVALLKEDASFAMPPLPAWYRGHAAIRSFVAANILDGEARGRWRLRPTRANGEPAFAWYRRDESSGEYRAFAIQTLVLRGGLIAGVTTFPTPGLFGYFALPPSLAP